MLRFNRFIGFVAVMALSFAMAACGSSTDNHDTTVADNGGTDTNEVVTPDNGTDQGQTDVRQDNGTVDAVDSVDPDAVDPDAVDPDAVDPDAVTDEGRPDIIQMDGYYLPNPVDPYADVLPKDVDWTSLPKLPTDKTFTAKYAAGVGVTSIVPDFIVYLGGFGNCTANDANCRKTDLVHDPVEARAVAIADTVNKEIVIFVGIDNVGLLDFDVVGIHRHVQKKLYESFGINFPGANAILAFSHAHSSIDTTGLWGPMMGAGRDEQYAALVVDRVAEACRLAIADLQDANLEWGASDFVQNYTGDPDNLDSKLWVIKGTKPSDSTPLFTLTRWAAHPTTYGDDDLTISSDYPGTFRFAMERDVGGKAIFMNGPIGDTYPNRPDTCGLEQEFFPEGDRTPGLEDGGQFMKATCTGLMVADAARQVLQNTLPLADTGISVKHDMLYFHPYNDFLMFAIESIPLPFPTCYADNTPCRIWGRYSLVRLGDLTFLTAPGEIFPTFAVDLEKVMKDAGLPNPMVVFAQGWMGYLMTADQFNDPDNGLDYNKGLCPGPDLYPAFIESLTDMVAAE